MEKLNAFVSFDFDNDHDLKGSLIAQAEDPESPFSLIDFSLTRAHHDSQWLSQAQSAIARCDVFIVLLGSRTSRAHGVLREVQIAKGLRKHRFQLKPQGTAPTSVKGAGPVVNWTWNKLKNMLSS